MSNPQIKHCSGCDSDKSVDDFYKKKSSLAGVYYHTYCKSCHNSNSSRNKNIRMKDVVKRNEVNEKQQIYLRKNPQIVAKNKIKFGKSYDSSPDRKNKKLIRKYGITLDEYTNMKAEQNSLCLICCKDKPLHVDHCHKTGVVRGLLCGSCNRAIGLLKDNPKTILSAAKYIANNTIYGSVI